MDSANVSYEAGRAIVGFDPAITSPDDFIAELERMTGFTAEVTTGAMEASDDEPMDANDTETHDHDDDAQEHAEGADKTPSTTSRWTKGAL